MPTETAMPTYGYRWAAPGDINAFFGLMLDNIANLLLTVSLLAIAFEFPTSYAIRHMLPGTSLGVLVGDLLYVWMAFSLARRTGRQDVTAMPLGLDTPSTFGMVLLVLGPAFVKAKANLPIEEAAQYAWHVGICSIFISGLFKFACALGSNWIRRLLPRAGLLGSLTAIALVLISFLPLLEILRYPVAGFVALGIVLTALVARVRLPFHIPGALGGLLVGGGVYYLMQWTQTQGPVMEPPHIRPEDALLPYEWLTVFSFQWRYALADTVPYLPVVIPFALGTVIGGIDCTESAAAAGDEYDTRQVIAVEAFATLVASCCGGVVQTTPYIGHPAYKAMGGRSAYTLATACFVGGAGLLGYFGYLYVIIPMPTVFPILIFVGLEITAQSFHATPQRHYPAVALACVPALAALVSMYVDKLFGDPALVGQQLSVAALDGVLRQELQTIRMLGNGFVVTSLLWASALASLIDRRLWLAAVYFVIAAACASCGVIHSPLPGNPVFLPWQLDWGLLQATTLQYAGGYTAIAVTLLLWGWWLGPISRPSSRPM
ncbi:MAG: permease [Planctomycetota bacterium]|nr:permease [Planctomycetota bacterium]